MFMLNKSYGITVLCLLMFLGCAAPPDKKIKAFGSSGEQSGQADQIEILPPHPADCLVDPACERIMVAAHRGNHTEHPENSLAAIRSAAEIGADFAEVDVRHTADGFPVLMHDSDVDRTTDGSGNVAEMTLDEVEALTLNGSDSENPESNRVPLFREALVLARELGVMLYVDQKTERWDLVLAEIQSAEYYREALVRDDAVVLAQMLAEDNNLQVMPPIETEEQLEQVIELLPGLHIVEIALPAPNPELCFAIKSAGLKSQQDVMVFGDVVGYLGDYTGWKSFVEAGVSLLQTDFPELLVDAVGQYNSTGIFPTSSIEK
jgi:glycerophosphoryl diester phosphodiesterase